MRVYWNQWKNVNTFRSKCCLQIETSFQRRKYHNNFKDIKTEEELQSAFENYDKKDVSNVLKDLQDLLHNTHISRKITNQEIKECANITRYINNSIGFVHFLNPHKRYTQEYKKSEGPKEQPNNGNSNVYYIYNIEKDKINKEEILKNETEEHQRGFQYLLNDYLYKFIYKLKKCDIWNYKEKNVNINYIDYEVLSAISYMNISNNQLSNLCTEPQYPLECSIFIHTIHKKNKDIFMNILKKVNFDLLNSAEINNVLFILSILHHNNKSFCTPTSKDKTEYNEENGSSSTNTSSSSSSIGVSKSVHEEYMKKKIFTDTFMHIYKCIQSKAQQYSFLYLYDHILLMCINDIKHKEAYTSIVNVLSMYVSTINTISNKGNEKNILQDPSLEIQEKEIQWDENRKSHNHLSETTSDFTQVEPFPKGEISANENKSVSKEHYVYLENMLNPLKHIIIAKVILIYIMKYVFSHIDSHILYSHSDLLSENLEKIHHYLITNFIFTIGTCKYIDEFCMFMLAKYVQNNISMYTAHEITVITNTYADASLEDVSFYETISDHIKNNFAKFSSPDIIKIMYAFSKVRIRDIELLHMAYKKINEFLIEREKKFNLLHNNNNNILSVYNDDSSNPNSLKSNSWEHNNNVEKNVTLAKKKSKFIINKYLCAYAIIAAMKLDYFDNLDKLFKHLRESILLDGIDIRGILWMPISITSFFSFECIFYFLPIYIDLIYKAFKRTKSSKLLTLLIRRHSILLHTIETNILPKKYIDEKTMKNLYFICKSMKDDSKEKMFIPDSSTFHIEVSNALLSLDIPHKKEVNVYPFTIDIYIVPFGENAKQKNVLTEYIDTEENTKMPNNKESIINTYYYETEQSDNYNSYANQNGIGTSKNKKISYDINTGFEQTFENKKIKNKAKNRNEVYTDLPFM